MTVCVAVKVHDCIVFAADSASTLQSKLPDGRTQVLNVYNNADKVFNLHRQLPLVAMTCGMGHIGGRSISTLAKDFRFHLSKGSLAINVEDYTVEQVAKLACGFLGPLYDREQGGAGAGGYLEFWIGGYGSSHTHGEIWKIVFSSGQANNPILVNSADVAQGIFWGGQGQAIARLLLGIDPAFIDAMVEAGLPLESAQSMFNEARSRMETPVHDATMPTIDAIRLATFLVDITKSYFSFAFGSDIVGGATDIATVTKWEGFKWITRKHFYPSELNRKDHDHVC